MKKQAFILTMVVGIGIVGCDADIDGVAGVPTGFYTNGEAKLYIYEQGDIYFNVSCYCSSTIEVVDAQDGEFLAVGEEWCTTGANPGFDPRVDVTLEATAIDGSRIDLLVVRGTEGSETTYELHRVPDFLSVIYEYEYCPPLQ